MRTLWIAVCVFVLCATAAVADVTGGKVLGPDGKPVAGASVAVRAIGGGITELTTDANGEFSTDLPPSGLPGNVLGWATILAPGYAVAGGLLKPGASEFHLVPGGEASGRVTDEAGKPVPGAHVYVLSIGPAGPQRKPHTGIFGSIKAKMSAETTADGRWVIGNMPSAGTASVRLEDPRFAQADAEIELGPGAPAAPPLVAIPGGVITGRVVLEKEGPAKGIGVFAQGIFDGYGFGAAESAADGAYRLSPLPAGPYNVMVDDSSGRWVAVAVQGLEVGKGQTVKAPDLVLTTGAMVEGTVTDTGTGQPAPGVMIGSYGPHRPYSSAAVSGAKANAAGKFRLRVAPGESRIYVVDVPDGYLRGKEDVTVTLAKGETKQVAFHVRKGLTVTGVVVDEKGAPAPGAQVQIVGNRESGDSDHYVSLQADGRFTLETMGVGPHTIYGTGDWRVISPEDLRLPLSGELRIVVRQLTCVPVTGRVITKAGLPVEGVKVHLMVYIPTETGGLGEGHDLVTDAQGCFSLPEVTARRDGASLGHQAGLHVRFRRAGGPARRRVSGRRHCLYVADEWSFRDRGGRPGKASGGCEGDVT